MEAIHANTEKLVVPILALHMVHKYASTAGKNFEYVEPELQSYFITPDGARAGAAAERLTFAEAVNRMMF